jgi:hypothetical protein
MSLRDELQRITDEFVADEIGQQIEHVATLRLRFPHRIELAQRAISELRETWLFNCFEFALGIPCNEFVWEVARRPFPGTEQRFVGSVFVRSLLPSLTEIPETYEGALLLWFDETGKPTHAGRWRDGRVRSKWGSGHTWDHAVMEVPRSYGDLLRFYEPPNRERVLAAFRHYAAT